MASKKIVTAVRRPKLPKVQKSKTFKTSVAGKQGQRDKSSPDVMMKKVQKAAKPRAGRPIPKFEV